MSRRQRPNAFTTSFPEEAPYVSYEATSLRPSPAASSSTLYSNPEKRKSDSLGPSDSENRASKRVHLPPPALYVNREGELETEDLIITGEDPFDREDATEDGNGEPDKPIRVLSNFAIYDPKHRNEMVSLNVIEEDDGVDRQFEGEGHVFPYFANDEDEGQEDEQGDEGAAQQQEKMIRLGAILRYTFDFTQSNDPVYIETQFAWYILEVPSAAYAPFFQHFLTLRRIAQMVVSTAIKNKHRSFDEFLGRFVSTVDPFGRTYKEGDLWDALPEIRDAVDDYEDFDLRTTSLIRYLFQKAAPPSSRSRPARRHGATRSRKLPPIKSLLAGNPDLAVLKRENMNSTHVTPFIASLAQGLVYEELVVVGGRPPLEDKIFKQSQKEVARLRLWELIHYAKLEKKKKKIELDKKDFVGRGTRYLRAVTVEGERYKIGDFVVIPRNFRAPKGQYTPDPAFWPDEIEDLNFSSTIADYFWFAKILYGDVDSSAGMFHVHWMQHSSQTMMEELGHPQELVYNDLCDHVAFGAIIGKVTVHDAPMPPKNPNEYFVKFTYNIPMATYISIDTERFDLAAQNPAPDNCPVCPLIEQHNQDKWDFPLKDNKGIVNGVAYGGHLYHYEEFILYRADQGPAHIGQITGFNFQDPVKEDIRTEVYIRRLGRISSLASSILPEKILKDERHLFLTDEKATVRLKHVISPCTVFSLHSLPNLKKWLSLSPLHFYISYTFPSMNIRSWAQHKLLPCTNLGVCGPCTEVKLTELKSMKEFLANVKQKPLRTLDIFGGVGAFSMGLTQGSKCLNVTDLVEISPSAAKTTMNNFPEIAVHNQCANEVLRYSIKQKLGQQPESPKQLFDGKTDVPSLTPPDVIVAGVPCQTHSTLNRFKKADDIKSNLILTALSFVDHLRPKFFYFENVPGFLGFTFDATQAHPHTVEGGTPMGGLKFVVRALVDMRYQVRFGYLQAGHYGTPQRRRRFFLVAAADGYPLPELPQPSHDFPDNTGLQIKILDGDDTVRVRPFRIARGTAPHPFVSIEDAISDLPRFDWKHPRSHRLPQERQLEMNKREWENIPALPCLPTSTQCGVSGADVAYHHPPRTSYQEAARTRKTKNIQHYTRTFKSRKIERVISIPLVAGADYRNLRPDQVEWQMSNPLSSVAQKNYRPGLYGRLDAQKFFPTTVTNMDTTAKQSWVLNPYCHRMITVRELARSQGFPDHFVFEAFGGNVITMHRQIGNAVPIPVGVALGRELRDAYFKKWLMNRQDTIVIDD